MRAILLGLLSLSAFAQWPALPSCGPATSPTCLYSVYYPPNGTLVIRPVPLPAGITVSTQPDGSMVINSSIVNPSSTYAFLQALPIPPPAVDSWCVVGGSTAPIMVTSVINPGLPTAQYQVSLMAKNSPAYTFARGQPSCSGILLTFVAPLDPSSTRATVYALVGN